MLLTQVKMDQNLVIGEFVQWNTEQLQFVRCTDHMNMIGVVDQAPIEINGSYVGVIRQAGVASAIAGEDLPANGGPLGVDANGRAIISNDHSCGLIQAQPFEQPARVAGDLVVIWLR
jgi:hypothetical protein